MDIVSRPKNHDLILLVSSVLLSLGLSICYQKAVFAVALLGFSAVTMVAFANVEIAITGALVWPYFQYFLTRDHKILPEFFTLVDEGFLASIVILMLWKLVRKELKIPFTMFEVSLLSFLTVGLLSAIFNRNPILNSILGFRCYIQYVVLYYAISYLELSEGFCRRLIDIMLGLVLVQVPLTVVQYFTWTPSSVVNDHADSAYGTFSFGSANMLGMLMLVFVLLVVKVKDVVPSAMKMIVLVSLTFSMILAHSKISYILLLVALFYDNVILMGRKIGLKKILLSVLGLLILIKIATLVSDDITFLFSYDNFMMLVENQIEDKEGGGRILTLLLTFAILWRYAFSSLIGLGPGMFSSYAGIGLKSRYLVDVLNIDLEHRGTRLDPDVIGVLGEYGYLGILCFFLLFAVLLFRKSPLTGRVPDDFWRQYSSWFKLFVLIFALGAFVNGVWQAQFIAVTFWVAAGIENRKRREAAP